MPDDVPDSVRRKVEAIFTELAGDRSRMLDSGTFPAGITSTITAALSGPDAGEEQVLRADQIALHLTDWSSDAAFIVAGGSVKLYCECVPFGQVHIHDDTPTTSPRPF